MLERVLVVFVFCAVRDAFEAKRLRGDVLADAQAYCSQVRAMARRQEWTEQ